MATVARNLVEYEKKRREISDKKRINGNAS